MSKKTTKQQHWSGIREAGTIAGMNFLYLVYRLFGRRLFSLILYPVALYFVLFKPAQRRASLDFLQRHYQLSPSSWKGKPHLGHVLLHFKTFAEVILDKLLGWLESIEENDFHLTSRKTVEALLEDKRGQLIIGTHFGNLEYCRGFMQRYKDKQINILVYDKHSSNFIEVMQRESPDSRLNVFQVDEIDVATILSLKNKVDQGEWVFIAGDRVPLSGLENTIKVNFLGDQAPFPIGPYMLAKTLACPVRLMFAYRHPSVDNKILFDVFNLADKLELKRGEKQEQLQNYAQQFATQLEGHCMRAPMQWFNFYDFWHLEHDE